MDSDLVRLCVSRIEPELCEVVPQPFLSAICSGAAAGLTPAEIVAPYTPAYNTFDLGPILHSIAELASFVAAVLTIYMAITRREKRKPKEHEIREELTEQHRHDPRITVVISEVNILLAAREKKSEHNS